MHSQPNIFKCVRPQTYVFCMLTTHVLGAAGRRSVFATYHPCKQDSVEVTVRVWCEGTGIPPTMPPAPPPVATPAPTAPATLVASQSTRRSPGSLLFARTNYTPQPLTSFQHHRAIGCGMVDPSTYHTSVDLNIPDLPSVTYDAYGAPASSGETRDLRRLVDEFRVAEAERCGCGVSDIAWFLQTHVKATERDPSNPRSLLETCGDGNSEMLSFSSTFSSGPCVASFGLLYMHLSIENSASVRAQEILAGAAPGTLPHILCIVMRLCLTGFVSFAIDSMCSDSFWMQSSGELNQQ